MNFKDINNKLFKIIIISIILMIIWMVAADTEQITGNIKKFNYSRLPAIVSVILISYLLRYIKFIYYLRMARFNVRNKDSLIIFLSALPMTITPGKVGELIKAYLLKVRYGYSISATSSVVVVERLTDAIGMVIIAGIGALAFDYGVGILILALMLTILGVCILRFKKVWYLFINILEKINLTSKYVNKIKHFYESSYNLLNIKVLFTATVIGMLAWIMEGTAAYLIVNACDIKISLILSIFTVSISSIAGAVSMIPGGLSVSEGSIFLVLLNNGALKGQASLAVFFIRLATLWFGVLVGTFVLLKVEKLWIVKEKSKV